MKSEEITFTNGINLSFEGIIQNLQNGHTYQITYKSVDSKYVIENIMELP
jgi:hypothetical protein